MALPSSGKMTRASAVAFAEKAAVCWSSWMTHSRLPVTVGGADVQLGPTAQ